MIPIGIESGGSRIWGSYGGAKTERLVGLLPEHGLGGTRTPDELRIAMENIFTVIRSGPALDDNAVICLWLSAAGYSLASADLLTDTVRDAAGRQGVKGVAYVANDATTLLLQPPRSGDGVIAIIGTGSAVVAAQGGRSKKFSGDEWVAGDLGSGFEIGFQGIRAAYAHFQGWGEETTLSERLIEWCNQQIGDLELHSSIIGLPPRERVPYVLRAVAGLGTGVKKVVARFAIMVMQEAKDQDSIALSIEANAATSIAKFIVRLCRWRNAELGTIVDPHEVIIDGFIGGQEHYFDMLTELTKTLPQGDFAVQLRRSGTALINQDSVPPSLSLARIAANDPDKIQNASDEFSVSRVEL